jgi:catechol 2,3-dioxygenase-like lactoylglutathione lyase family enzyme
MLAVRDLERALAFYRDVLGMEVVHVIPEGFAFLDGGSVSLALRQVTSWPSGGNPGLVEVVLETPDVQVAYEELGRKGVAFSQAPRAVTGDATHDLYATDFTDPDGHVLSITGRVPRRGA